MATSRCTTCGLIRQDCQCPHQPIEITPVCCSIWYLFFTIMLFIIAFTLTGKIVIDKELCYLELFVNSISNTNTNANISTGDWRIGLVSKSPVTHCKIKLHAIESRLLLGENVIFSSPMSLDGFGKLVTFDKWDKPVINVDFKNVVTPRVVGGVVWDYKVEFVLGMKGSKHGFLMVVCGDIPVIFTADPVGNMVGSLLGNMKRCDYVYQYELIKNSV